MGGGSGVWWALAGAGGLALLSGGLSGSLAKKKRLAPLQRRLLGVSRAYGSVDPEAVIRAQDVVISALGGGHDIGSMNAAVATLIGDIQYVTGNPAAGLPEYLIYVNDEIGRDGHFTRVTLARSTKYDKLVEWVTREVRRILKAARKGTLTGRTPARARRKYDARGITVSDQEALALYKINAIAKGLGRVADWIEVERPDLSRLTWNQAKRASDRYHKELERIARAAGVLPGSVVHTWPDGWTLQNLTERKQLQTEGKAMGHCVGTVQSYWYAVRDGRHAIYSVRDEVGVPHWTLEIELEGGRPFKTLQTKGHGDRLPKGKDTCIRLKEALIDVLGIAPGRAISCGDMQHCRARIEKLLAPPQQRSRRQR